MAAAALNIQSSRSAPAKHADALRDIHSLIAAAGGAASILATHILDTDGDVNAVNAAFALRGLLDVLAFRLDVEEMAVRKAGL